MKKSAKSQYVKTLKYVKNQSVNISILVMRNIRIAMETLYVMMKKSAWKPLMKTGILYATLKISASNQYVIHQ